MWPYPYKASKFADRKSHKSYAESPLARDLLRNVVVGGNTAMNFILNDGGVCGYRVDWTGSV
jgi:hypothetical protein